MLPCMIGLFAASLWLPVFPVTDMNNVAMIFAFNCEGGKSNLRNRNMIPSG
ncbi:hypothetical protein M758_9G045600 [Ceratodon purpureus]|uniref:Uncharacterized protein n=1 Tax=Ceratodon purpureus TaxID=3225 RepID=A0A8T0GNR0_CERPU|nr:hypothetical protein KC19_9G046200 [Ceratodon purpureus]KAG0605280.1 hypothetical protein M758_9G045600 [Ceratodon purpureus]